ncbi:hypothetical protein ACFFMN_40280 [Planobispora siamensis]|uniref:Uncharacterized protein n=1 Tax=Planobispora siamensis TaxID=936338 RepID=A0A8J3SPD2_9ACTN|nr:hypothetical protein [Planobispora siamensis]GIH97852.1 hypothetical protein Psi01_84820 [Planobispora siamensis]
MPPPDDPAGSRTARSIDEPGTPRQHRAPHAREYSTAAAARAERRGQQSEHADQLIERSEQRIERADQLIERSEQRIKGSDQRIERAGQLIKGDDRLRAASSDRLSPRQAPAPTGTGEVSATAEKGQR